MSKELSITRGPWFFRAGTTTGAEVVGSKPRGGDYVIARCGGKDREANARLITEAGNISNTTGLTPRQLAEQRAALLEALEQCVIDLSNTRTNIMSELAKGNDRWDGVPEILGRRLESYRAAIALAQGDAA